MRENRTYGSEGGEAKAFPTPINVGSYDPASGRRDGRAGDDTTGGLLTYLNCY